jgi:hypothetical protein
LLGIVFDEEDPARSRDRFVGRRPRRLVSREVCFKRVTERLQLATRSLDIETVYACGSNAFFQLPRALTDQGQPDRAAQTGGAMEQLRERLARASIHIGADRVDHQSERVEAFEETGDEPLTDGQKDRVRIVVVER